MSFQEDERRWKRIQDMLAAEASGQTLRPIASQRTLFGIPSEMEKRIDKIVAEDEAKRRAKRQEHNGPSAKKSDEAACDSKPIMTHDDEM